MINKSTIPRQLFLACVQCVVIDANTPEKVLVGRWRDTNIITMPGGHIEGTDSDVPSAARRELKEETGLDLTPIDIEQPFINKIDGNLYIHIPVVFYVDGAVKVAPNEEFEALWWAPITCSFGKPPTFDMLASDTLSLSTATTLHRLWR